MARQEFDENVRKIKDWLTDEGILRDKVPDDTASYHVQVESPPKSGRLIDVIIPKQREDLVIVASATALAKEHYDGLKAKPEDERKNILWDMRFQLLFGEVGFRMIPNAEDFQRIEFTRPMHFDGLSRNMFLNALQEDFKAHLFIVWTMARLFGEEPPKSTEVMYS